MCEAAASLAEKCCLANEDMGSHGRLMQWGTLRYLRLLRIKVPPPAAAAAAMSEGCGKKGLVFSGSPRYLLPGQRELEVISWLASPNAGARNTHFSICWSGGLTMLS